MKRLQFKEVQLHLCKRYGMDAATAAMTARDLMHPLFNGRRLFASVEELDQQLDLLEAQDV